MVRDIQCNVASERWLLQQCSVRLEHWIVRLYIMLTVLQLLVGKIYSTFFFMVNKRKISPTCKLNYCKSKLSFLKNKNGRLFSSNQQIVHDNTSVMNSMFIFYSEGILKASLEIGPH